MSGFLKLNWTDVAHGLAIAVVTVVLGGLQQSLTAHGFDFAHYDWAGILDLAFKTGGSFIVTQLLTTSEGKVLGAVKIK